MNMDQISYLERKAYIEENELALELYEEFKKVLEDGIEMSIECPYCDYEVYRKVYPKDF